MINNQEKLFPNQQKKVFWKRIREYSDIIGIFDTDDGHR